MNLVPIGRVVGSLSDERGVVPTAIYDDGIPAKEHDMSHGEQGPLKYNRWLVLAIVVVGNAMMTFAMFSDLWDID